MEKPPDDYKTIFLLVVASVILLLFSVLFSISESAFLSLNKLRLRINCKAGNRRALLVHKLLSKKDELINTLLIANDLVNISLSSVFTSLALIFFGNGSEAIAVLGATVFLLIFGEITPKAIAARFPDAIAYALSPTVFLVRLIFKPVAFLFTKIARAILFLFGVRETEKKQTFSEEEIKTFIDVSTEQGILEKTENVMMKRVFAFTDLETQDIMTPRIKIVALHIDETYRDILEKAERTHLSRFPVYKKNIDDIIGVVYVKDLLSYKNSIADFSIAKILRKPLFVLGTKKMSSLQEEMRKNHQSIAIVLDEYSGVDGIVTQDAISEAIFGVVSMSEFSHAEHSFEKIDNIENFFVDGRTLLTNIQNELHISFDEAMSETLAGWMLEKLGALSKVGDAINFSGYRFEVCEVEKNRIAKIHVTRIEASDR